MIKKWLSRYNLHYPRFLVYMLQVSEYNIRDYFNWYHKAKNFSNIEQRKRLVKTPKSFFLLTATWIILLFTLVIDFLILRFIVFPFRYILFFLILLSIPYFLAYIIIIPLFILKIFIQMPIEYLIIKKT